jgi:colicin import membrane protein
MKMRTASAISTGLHIAVLAWATFSFTGKTLEATPPESLPVDLISDKQFSEITKGVKDAPKPKPQEKPKPLVEKKAETPQKPIEEAKPKVDEKKEVAINKEATATPDPPPEPDPIKDKLEKPKEKPQEAKAAEPKPLPPHRPPRPKPKEAKFEPDKIAALLDKRDPTRSAIVGQELNDKATLGAASGTAARLSQSEIDALRQRIASCWSIPAGAEDAGNLKVVFRVMFRRDGTILRGPATVEGTTSPFGPAFADSGRRAILQCQPYTMLRPEHYDMWKDIEIGFKPSDMFK